MKKDGDPLFIKSGEVDALLVRQPFFLLSNHVVLVFPLKDRLIILRTVTYEVCRKICS